MENELQSAQLGANAHIIIAASNFGIFIQYQTNESDGVLMYAI